MDKKDNSNNLEIMPEDALIDGLSHITQKLYSFFDGKRSNIMPISELLLRLTIPRHKKEINSEDIFVAVEEIISILDSMKQRRDSGLN